MDHKGDYEYMAKKKHRSVLTKVLSLPLKMLFSFKVFCMLNCVRTEMRSKHISKRRDTKMM